MFPEGKSQKKKDITEIMYYLEHETVHVSFWEDEE